MTRDARVATVVATAAHEVMVTIAVQASPRGAGEDSVPIAVSAAIGRSARALRTAVRGPVLGRVTARASTTFVHASMPEKGPALACRGKSGDRLASAAPMSA
jgi:hypothetical protein